MLYCILINSKTPSNDPVYEPSNQERLTAHHLSIVRLYGRSRVTLRSCLFGKHTIPNQFNVRTQEEAEDKDLVLGKKNRLRASGRFE